MLEKLTGQIYDFKKLSLEDYWPIYKAAYVAPNNAYYFRTDLDRAKEKVEALKGGYGIYLADQLIGGTFIHDRIVSETFVIDDQMPLKSIYEDLITCLQRHHGTSKPIVLQEVLEKHLDHIPKGEMGDVGYWMCGTTNIEYMDLPWGYQARPIRHDDAQAIGKMIHRTYDASPWFKKIYDPKVYTQSVVDFLNGYPSHTPIYKASRVIVETTEENIVGVLYCMIFEGMPLITQLAIHPDCQGKGMGSHLIYLAGQALSEAYDKLRLYVFRDNPALRMYEGLGFEKHRHLSDWLVGEYDE